MKQVLSQPGPMEQARPGDAGYGSAASRAGSATTGSEQSFIRLDLLRSLQMHKRMAFAIAAAGLALAGVSVALKFPTYTADSQVFIQPAAPQIMSSESKANWPNDTNSYDTVIQQQMQAVTHPNVLLSALKKIGPGFQQDGENEQAAMARLAKAVEAKRLATSYQIMITAQSKDAELSARIANSMAMALVENASQQEKSGDSERLAMLRAEQEKVEKELAADRTEQEGLNAKLGTASIGGGAVNHYDSDISALRDELIKARATRDEAAARLATMQAVKGATPQALDAEADELAATDPGLVSMKMSLNQRRAVLIGQMANLTPNHPQYKQDAAELAQIDSSLDAMMKDLRAKVSARIEQRLHTDLDRTTAVQDRLNGQLSQLAAAAGGATPQMQRAADLANNIARLQNRYAVLDEQVRNLTLQANAPGSAYFSAVASIPIHIAWALVLKKAMMYALGGIVLALLAALIAHNLDQRIYVASDVTSVLGFAPMAQLPDFHEVTPGIAEDHILRLAAALDHACRQGNLRNCIFTAIGSGAGTTTVATRVRAVLESMGRPAVLLDASGAPVQSQVQTSLHSKGNSFAVVAADRTGRSAALMQQSGDEEEEVESLVLTDTAPLTISAETEYLARYVDAAIVVLEAGVTTRAQLRAAADTLTRLDVAAVGFVLNKVGLKTADLPFRNTVRAMEQHQDLQSRITPRFKRQPQNTVPEMGAGRAAASLDKGSAPNSIRELAPEAVAQVPPAQVRPSAESIRTPASVGPAQVASPRPPAIPRERPLSAETEAKDLPRGNPASAESVQPAPAPAMPARPFSQPLPQEAQAPRPTPVPAPVRAEAAVAQSAPASSPVPAAASTRPDPQTQQAALPREPMRDPARAQLQEWEEFAASTATRPEPARPAASENLSRREPLAATQASQLGSLRDLSFAEAMKNLPRTAPAPAQPPRLVDLPQAHLQVETPHSAEARFQQPLAAVRNQDSGAPRPAAPRPPDSRPLAPQPAPVRPVAARPATAQTTVTAQPEFLPPRPADDPDGKAAKKAGPVPRRDRHDSIDDVQVLPSWRGQYKKR